MPSSGPCALPRLCVTALAGGGGKTLLTLGLAGALRRQGLTVQPFKKGPDYIDAAWLALAAGRPCTNLDPYFLPPERLRALFVHTLRTACAVFSGPGGADVAGQAASVLGLVEGNRGLFDGLDVAGSCSTAALARELACPVLLSLDCTKMTRTAAAVVRGVQAFEPDVPLVGVVLNRVGSARHENLLRRALETYTDLPVLGLARHAPPFTAAAFWPATPELAATVSADQTTSAPHATGTPPPDPAPAVCICSAAPRALVVPPVVAERTPCAAPAPARETAPRIGYVRDAALWFYYGENLEALERAGARLIRLSTLDAAPWPALDGLYLGGGFPEDCAAELSLSPQLTGLRRLADAGLPIYAECGGFMLLSQGIEREGRLWPMAGIFPVTAQFLPRPQGLGYVCGRVTAANPFFPLGLELRGHEFHYSRCRWQGNPPHFALRLDKGVGMGRAQGQTLDGLLHRQVWASYTHIFAPAVPCWAHNFAAAARAFAERARKKRENSGQARG